MTMSTENSLIDAALRGWKSNVERVDNLFGTLSPEQLEQQVTPGKNRLIYLWGHLAAVNDGLLPLLGIGERLRPELDAMFISKPDRSVELKVTAQSLKSAWDKINQRLWEGFRSSRRRIGRDGIPRCRKRISSGNRIGIDSPCCSEGLRTLPITWVRPLWPGQRHS